ncbi:MAG: hypothetical protein C3F07_17615 [Anaerolineales bacterium]|nr:MAG: hypothetical protein C3F07_17615 [Anaerolineales bacterium]
MKDKYRSPYERQKELLQVISSYRKNSSERGQTLIIIAIALIGLLGITGLVIDGGNVFLDRRRAQNAADSAALAAALARIRGGGNYTNAALESAAQNGYNNDGVTNTVSVRIPPTSGPHAGDIEYIQVIIVSHVKTYISSVIGRNEFINEVQAVARTKPSETKQLLNGMALVSLVPDSNCGNNKAFWLHGNAALEITGGGVFVNSGNQNCALTQNGNGSLRVNGGQSINVVGGATLEKPQLLTPSVTIGVTPSNYPPAFFLPNVDCEGEPAEVSADGTTMSPGEWDEPFPPEGVTTLEPGVYCLGDGMKVTGALAGNGVLFFVKDGNVEITGGAEVKVSAPTEGDNAGLLFYLPMDNNGTIVVNGGAGSSFSGTILAPASPINLKGGPSGLNFLSQIVGYTIEAEGKIVITYNDAQNFDALTQPEVQLSE